jgi:hypothetical protein
MHAARPAVASLLHRLALLPAVLLVLGLVVGAVHDHAQDGGARACAICTLSHAPATTTVAEAEPAPAPRVERVALPAADAPRAARPASRLSRAPPSI